MARILVVEDEPSLCLLCRLELADEGFEVRTASCAAEARRAVVDWHPDLAVVDVQLGPANGMELLRYLCAAHPSVRTVVYTGYDPVAVASAWSADAVLVKSIDLTELKRTVHRLVAAI